jgi:hypothetical protein
MLKRRDSFAELTAKTSMTKKSKLIQSNDMVVDALNILEDFSSLSGYSELDAKAFYIYDILKGIV